jgi:outer membrane protein TolC
MRAAAFGLEAYEEQYRQAWWAWFPTFDFDFRTTAIPPQPVGQTNDLGVFLEGSGGTRASQIDATGTIFDLVVPQGPNLTEWNVWVKMDVSAVMPIYTFGKLASLRRMAQAGVDIARTAGEMAEGELRFQVARAWWGLSLAKQLDVLIADGESQLKKARDRLIRLDEEDSDEYDQDDMFRLRIYEAQVKKLVLQNGQLNQMATSGLRVALDFEADENLNLPEQMPLVATTFDVGQLDCYIELAGRHRPELAIKRSTVEVRAGNVDKRFAEFFPDIFLAASFTFAHTTENGRAAGESQNSIFSGAVFDALGGGVALGLKLNLDYIQKDSRYRQAQAELNRARAELDVERSKLRLELEQIWRDTRDQAELESVVRRAMKAAKSLLTSKAQLYEDGLEPLPFKDVLDASVTHVQQKSEWLKTVYALNVSVAQLSRVVGTDVTAHQCPKTVKGSPK